MCFFGCTNDTVSRSTKGASLKSIFKSEDFIEYSLPLKCFSNNSSLDLSKVNLPMYLATKGPLDLDLMNVEIGRDKGDKVLKCY